MEGFDELLDGLMTAVWIVGTSVFIIFTSCHKAVFFKLFFLVYHSHNIHPVYVPLTQYFYVHVPLGTANINT